jgi:hypothetical protein
LRGLEVFREVHEVVSPVHRKSKQGVIVLHLI